MKRFGLICAVIFLTILVGSIFISCSNSADYTVTLDTNGGTENGITATIAEGEAIVPVPVREGYAFDGWYLDNNSFDIPFKAEDAVEILEANNLNGATIYAKWEEVSFNITYILNNNNSDIKSTYTISTVTFNLPVPARDGYEFKGWYDNEIFSGSAITSIVSGNIGDKYFYAKWSPYDIMYIMNGGSNNTSNLASYSDADVANGGITLLEPSRPGYTFRGWYDNAAFAEEAITAIPQGGTRNRNFYAKWQINTYTITYDLNGGTNNANNPAMYTVLQNITILNPSKAGYNFNGWYNGEVLSTGISAGTTGNIMLTARWIAISYNITYNLYGGIKNDANPDTYNIEDSVSFAAPTKAGYNFIGWVDGTNAGTTGITLGSTGNKVIYAVWKEISYLISYEFYNGKNNPANGDLYNLATPVTIYNPSKTGFTFIGWYDNEEFSGSKITGLPIEGRIGSITLYAKFLKTYNITYNLNGGLNNANNKTVFTEENIVDLYAPSYTGYNFDGWHYSEDLSDAAVSSIPVNTKYDVVLYAKWDIIQYNISYIFNGGSNPGNTSQYNIQSNLSLAGSLRTGYNFIGWYNNVSFSGNAVTSISSGNYGNLTFYAKWELTAYDIVYNTDGGTNNYHNPATYTINDTVHFLSATKSGFVFDGWFYDTSETGFSLPATDIPLNNTGAVTIYAKFLTSYAITYYNISGGTNNAANPNFYTEKDAVTLLNPTKSLYSFIAWYDNANLTGNAVNSIPLGSTGTRVFYAKFLLKYTIGYTLNGGMNSLSNPAFYTIEDSVTLAEPTRLGCSFQGWYDNNTFTGSAVVGISKGSTVNKSFFAKWFVNRYNIVYEENGGENDSYNPSTYSVLEDITLLPASKEGYLFKGWYYDIGFTSSSVTSINSGSTGDKKLYAKFLFIYSITYNENGGVNSPSNPITFTSETNINLIAATKTGYDFAGWKEEGTNQAINKIQNISRNLILNANWTPSVYSITYNNLSGGTTSNPASYTIEDNITLSDGIRTHYNFIGWYENAQFTGEEVAAISAKTGSITLFALWEGYPYTIDYRLDGGSINESDPLEYTIEQNITLAKPTKNEFTFEGWYSAANFSGLAITEIALGSYGEKTFYAKWSIVTYTITYILKGGINSVSNPATYNSTTQIALASPTKTESTFYGWFEYDTTGITTQKLESDHIYPVTAISAGSVGNKILYARWNADPYVISYSYPSGAINHSGNPSVYTKDDTIVFYSPSYTGYTFKGWYRNSGFTGDRVTYIPEGSSGNVSLYAKFSLTYTITYILNGGTFQNDPSQYTAADEAITLGTPIKSGFTFIGWYDNADFNGSIYTIIPAGSTGNKVFQAKFLQLFNIKYNLNAGINHPGNSDIFTVESSFIFNDPQKEGYAFIGWYVTEDFTGEKITGIAAGTSANKVVYAKFLFINNITYIMNEGVNNPGNPLYFTVEDSITLLDPARLGFTFNGWYDNTNFSGEPVIVVGGNSSGLRNLYAKWTIITYTITYITNLGLNNSNNPSSYNVLTETITLIGAGRTSYLFAGWYDNINLTGTAITKINKGSTGNVTIYAKWTPVTYTITYELYSGTNGVNPANFTIESETITFAAATRAGASFVHWHDNSSFVGSPTTQIVQGSTGNRTFYAEWSLSTFNINYNLNGGTNSSKNVLTCKVSDTVILYEAILPGKTFLGWYDNTEFTGNAILQLTGTIADVTLYARFETTYVISYSLYSGINNTANPTKYTQYSADINLLPATKTYYDFAGWYSDAEYNSQVTVIASGSTGNINLFAKWTPTIYTVSYVLNGGENDINNPANYNVQTEKTLYDALKTGYSFMGWYDNNLFSGSAKEAITLGSAGNKTYYAKWEIDEYTITYTLNNGTNDYRNPFVYTIEDIITLENAVRTGYTFTGWTVGGAPVTVIEVFNGDKTIVANWQISIYTITYNNIFGGTTANPSSYTIADSYIFSNAVREYYNFVNWYDNIYFTGNPISGVDGSTGNLNLYAKWEAVEYGISYNLDFGKNHLDNPKTYNVTDNIILKDATKASYNFMGWYDNPEFDGTAIAEIEEGGFGEIQLYAKFLTSYVIDYETYGASNAENPLSYTAEDNVILKALVKEDYLFMGWYNNAAFTGDALSGIPYGSTGEKIFYAKFLEIFVVTYYLNGGTNSQNNPLYYFSQETDIILEAPTRADYRFIGWYDNQEFEGEPIMEIKAGSSSNIVLYARWGVWQYYFYFGEYPQTKAEINAVAEMGAVADVNGYYISSYDGERYAKVISGTSNAELNGYTIGETYYFKVEPIKWKIIFTGSGNDSYLISDVNLDTMTYNDMYEDIIWLESSIRTWLNNSTANGFSGAAFGTDAELNDITSAISINASYATSSEIAATDKVTLLSIEQASNSSYGYSEDLTEEDEQRRSKNSDYAIAKGAYTDNEGYGCWWLYTPGSSEKYAAFVGSDGKVYANGNNIIMTGYVVKPVIFFNSIG